MIELQRITTQYIDAEDRIRLSGESSEGGERTTLVLWLTQRLLSQLISHLIGLIEKQSGEQSSDSGSKTPVSNLMQGFAQQAAESELAAELPVKTEAVSQSWLVQEVDIALSAEGALVLVFKRDLGGTEQENSGAKATLSVEAKQLRQWLGIIHTQWQQAGWPLTIWPTWMDEQAATDIGKGLH